MMLKTSKPEGLGAQEKNSKMGFTAPMGELKHSLDTLGTLSWM
jgi:hypothetical protein